MPVVMTERKLAATLVVLVFVACGLVAWATKYGIGVTPDSVAYLNGAANLAAGRGYCALLPGNWCRPIIHFPPGYSATLVPLVLAGLEPVVAAKVLALLLMAANLLAAACATKFFTGSRAAALLVASIMATSPQLLLVHTAAWSEQGFILLVVAALLSLNVYVQEGKRAALLVAALFTALAWLFRIAGVGLFAAGLLAIVVLRPGPLLLRVRDASIFAIVSAPPTAAWMMRNLAVAGVITMRGLQPVKLSFDHLQALSATVSAWWLPGVDRVQFVPGQDALTALATGGFLVFLAYVVVRRVVPSIGARRELVRTPVIFLAYAVIHVLTILAVIAVWAGEVTLDNRILAPSFVTFLIAAAYVLHIAVRPSAGRFVRNLAWMLSLAVVAGSVASGAALVSYFHREGRGYNSPNWDYPAIAERLSEIDAAIPVFSNQPLAIRFLMKRYAVDASPAELGEALRASREAVVVYFDNPRTFSPRHEANVRLAPATPEVRESLLAGVATRLLVRERNAWLYLVRPPAAP